ncbi:MAG: Tfp pilus assembly protein PilF [Parcubacteria group bacterium Gr01-1014_24]|nr:MAG: Tfp pilus assembly protein PilF [Parcubacteria group bacterium Gr01-1014_24]
MRANIFDRLSSLSLFLVIILLPFFFLPFTNIPIEISKGVLLVVGLVICVIFWAIARFFDGKIILPKSMCLLAGAGVVLAFFLSALFSKAAEVSFFGTMFDIGAFYFIFSAFLLMLMASIIFRNPKNARIVLFGAILSSAVVLIFQTAHLFIPKVLSLGILVEKTGNVLGSWNAFGLFAGFTSLLSLLVVEFFPTTKTEKLLFQALIVLSMFLVAAVNFPLVWGLIGIFSLIIFVYKVSITSNEKAEGEKPHFPVFSFAIIMVALLFFISGDFIGGILPNRLGLSNNEVSPSFGATMQVTKSVLRENPLLGVGPNKFGEAWANYKPAAINLTQFWDVSFNSGSGLLPTFAATTGYLGILAWLIFFILFIIAGVKSIFSSIKNSANWETMAFFVLSLYLFISSFFYSTGAVIFLLAFALAGVFIGLSASSLQKEASVSFLNDHRKSFFSILFIVLIIIVSVTLSFKYAERLISISYFGKALTTSTVPIAEESINKALTLYANDLYLRTYAQIYLVKLNSLAQKGASLSDRDKADLQTSLSQTINAARLATTYNPKNYLNFKLLGSAYQTAATLGVKDAYSQAVEAYKTASALNPLNPGLKLDMASASFSDRKNKEAKDYANRALALKPDYIDALIVLSQIAKSENDNKGALAYAQTALSLAPANQDLVKYVDSFNAAEKDNSTKKKQ